MNKSSIQKKNNQSKLPKPTLYNYEKLEYCPNTRTLDPRAMKFIILEEGLILVKTMYGLIPRSRGETFSKNFCIHLEPHPYTRTPDPGSTVLTFFEEELFLIIPSSAENSGAKGNISKELMRSSRKNSDPGAMKMTILE